MLSRQAKGLILVFGEILMGIFVVSLSELQGSALIIACLGVIAMLLLWIGLSGL